MSPVSRAQQKPVCTNAALDGVLQERDTAGVTCAAPQRSTHRPGKMPTHRPTLRNATAGNQLSQTQAPQFCPGHMLSAFLQLRTPCAGLKIPLQRDLAEDGTLSIRLPSAFAPGSLPGWVMQGPFAPWVMRGALASVWRGEEPGGEGAEAEDRDRAVKPEPAVSSATCRSHGEGPQEPALKPRVLHVAANGHRVACSCYENRAVDQYSSSVTKHSLLSKSITAPSRRTCG